MHSQIIRRNYINATIANETHLENLSPNEIFPNHSSHVPTSDVNWWSLFQCRLSDKMTHYLRSISSRLSVALFRHTFSEWDRFDDCPGGSTHTHTHTFVYLTDRKYGIRAVNWLVFVYFVRLKLINDLAVPFSKFNSILRLNTPDSFEFDFVSIASRRPTNFWIFWYHNFQS